MELTNGLVKSIDGLGQIPLNLYGNYRILHHQHLSLEIRRLSIILIDVSLIMMRLESVY